jgi:hypothetical protein
MTEFSKLPPEVRDAALRGLRDPEDSGAPYTAEEVVSDFTAGLVIQQRNIQIGKAANTAAAPVDISPRAATAPDALDHAALGPVPEELIK